MIELFWSAGLPCFYWWSVIEKGQLLSPDVPCDSATLHGAFLSNVILFGLMSIASFIDIDEKTIPDMVTVPGTLIALLLAALLPNTLPPIGSPPTPLMFTSPASWHPGLDYPFHNGLAVGLSCWLGWCTALLPRTVYFRRGLSKGLRFLFVSMVRQAVSRWIFGMALVGLLLIVVAWMVGGATWHGLLTSLVGLAVAGGLVWAIRVVASLVMGTEAMGFGDVTLLAMIGAFLGWQPGHAVFWALAPFCACLLLPILLILRVGIIPYGPFLCAGATLAVFLWPRVWATWESYSAALGYLFGSLGGFEMAAMSFGLVGALATCLSLVKLCKRSLGIET